MEDELRPTVGQQPGQLLLRSGPGVQRLDSDRHDRPIARASPHHRIDRADVLRRDRKGWPYSKPFLIPKLPTTDFGCDRPSTVDEQWEAIRPFQSCHLGYWAGAAANGWGVATVGARDIVRVAFEQLGLHRIEAGTLPHIAGQWQDHVMYQLIADHPE
ncbi:GNAT family N-acetyltransferase [Micromonospora sp. NPDC003197]